MLAFSSRHHCVIVQPHGAPSVSVYVYVTAPPAAGISHLENVDMDERHREHCSAHKHAEQSGERRLEPGHMDQQPVL